MKWLRTLPTTQIRVLVTLVVVLATATRYLSDGWVPADSWLVFLGAMSGLDIAQFAAKRVTHRATGTDGEPQP